MARARAAASFAVVLPRPEGEAVNITVYLKNGETLTFKHEGRAGGSYTKEIRYEGAFAIITDEYGRETAIPAENIESVRSEPSRSW